MDDLRSTIEVVKGDLSEDFLDAIQGSPDDRNMSHACIDIETGRCDFKKPRYWEETSIGLVTIYSKELDRVQLIRVHDPGNMDRE